MSEEFEREHHDSVNSTSPRWVSVAVVILAIASVVAIGTGYSASNRANRIEQDLTAQVQTQTSSLRDSVDMLGKRLKQAEENTAQAQGELSVVTDRLKLTQGELARARKQGKEFQEQYAKNLEDVEASVRTELATKASSSDVNNLNTDVTGVKTDLESTKQNLQMAKGEMGTLIARNHEEIDQLRRLGQRDYFEFTLGNKGAREKLANNIQVELRGTNANRHQFTIALFTDDLRLEKKNRSINEPIYFYTRGTRAPLELVVNEVGKNKVVGYLSVPKVLSASAGK
jgi:chromosome segregation ATPase